MDAVAFALLCLACAAIGWSIRILAADRSMLRDVLRYRGPGWPSGVQEDDDLHWRWRPAPSPSAPKTERLLPHIGTASPIEALRRRRH